MASDGSSWTERWRRFVEEFELSGRHRHEASALRACRLALRAAELGSYGVGAVLVDARGEVLAEGYNEVYLNGFRSDRHAEMVDRPREMARDCTLVTSLEPCPMCMTRLIVAGIGSVLYVSPDSVGGMVHRRHGLPPVFRTITEHQHQLWAQADCSDTLREAAFRIWVESRDRLDQGSPRPAGGGRPD